MFYIIEEAICNTTLTTRVLAEFENCDMEKAMQSLYIHQLSLILASFETQEYTMVLHAVDINSTAFYRDSCIVRCRIVRYDTIKAAIECQPDWQKTVTFSNVLEFDFGDYDVAVSMQTCVHTMVVLARNSKADKDMSDMSDYLTSASVSAFDLGQDSFEGHLDTIFTN